MLIAYTCGGQKSRSHAYTLIAYTCGGQKSKGHTRTLITYTCLGQMSSGTNPDSVQKTFSHILGPLAPS